MNAIIEVIIVLLSGIAVGCAIYYLGQLSQQVQYVMLADGRRQERSLPVLIRLILPLAGLGSGFLGHPAFQKYLTDVNRKIISAGFDGLITARELVMCRFWMAAICFALGMLNAHHLSMRLFSVVIIITLCGFYYPSSWLNGTVARRHKVIQRGLPIVLDLLTLCVEAGLDFMSALSKIIERRKNDALNEEILQVFHAIKLGRTRRQALKELGERVNLPDLSIITNALIQADELGVSLGAILRIQADQLRTKRFQRAETLANQAPVKMLFPLVLIFIAAFFILLGPPLLQMLGGTGGAP
jgi:tight adherence protein C